VQGKDGKWRAAEVLLPSGYIDPEPNFAKIPFDTAAQCQKACDLHNRLFWTAEEVNSIISLSMNHAV
jgi:hypothetical protein